MVDEQQSRLSPIKRDSDLLPLRRGRQLARCALYWIPVSSFPIPSDQRLWLQLFLDRLSSVIQKAYKLRAEVFLQCKTIFPALVECFNENAFDLVPVLGFAQRPGQEIPSIPTMQDLEPILDGRQSYDYRKYVGDFCYWFVRKDEKWQRELFWGHGGLTMLFLAPDPKINIQPLKIPKYVREYPGFDELFKVFDPDKTAADAYALSDRFRKKSLELFSEDIKKNVQLKGMPFIIPLLRSRDFFARPEKEFSSWFELFDLYVNESPDDNGILIASKLDIEENLINILSQMKEEGHRYSSPGA